MEVIASFRKPEPPQYQVMKNLTTPGIAPSGAAVPLHRARVCGSVDIASVYGLPGPPDSRNAGHGMRLIVLLGLGTPLSR